MSAAAALALLGLAWWRRQPLVPSVLLAGAAVADVAAGARTPIAVPELANPAPASAASRSVFRPAAVIVSGAIPRATSSVRR